MPKVSRVQVLENFRVYLEFEDGVSGEVDLSHLAGKGIFKAWMDPANFNDVRIGSSGELVWNMGADLCPDPLYLKITGKKPDELFPILRSVSIHA